MPVIAAITFRKHFVSYQEYFLKGVKILLVETFVESLLYFRYSAKESKIDNITSSFLRKTPTGYWGCKSHQPLLHNCKEPPCE